MDEVLTVEEVAALLKLKPATIYSWVQKRQIPFHKLGGAVRFYKNEVLEYFKTR
jgi:excisionase family DNA binding protein